MSKSPTQEEQKAKWYAAKADFLSAISDIDSETPWSNTEPAWWLEMMAAQRAVSNPPKA